jgi:hypothetical protein
MRGSTPSPRASGGEHTPRDVLCPGDQLPGNPGDPADKGLGVRHWACLTLTGASARPRRAVDAARADASGGWTGHHGRRRRTGQAALLPVLRRGKPPSARPDARLPLSYRRF